MAVNDEKPNLVLAQIIKPHNKALTALSINKTGDILVSSGEDLTIFIFQLVDKNSFTQLVPIGFFPTSDIVTCITWHYEFVKIFQTILLRGLNIILFL